MSKWLVVVWAVFLGSVVGCSSSSKKVSFKSESFKYGDKTRKYAVYTPAKYDASKRYPTVLFLHGLFESGNDGRGSTKVGIGPAIKEHPDRFNCIVIFAQTSSSWRDDDQLPLAIATLDDVSKRYSVDRSRVTVTGLSTGGAAVWKLGARYPGRFAALMPLCAFSSEEDVPNLTRYPIWAFHNRFDPFVGVWNTSGMASKVNSAGGHAKHTVYNGFGHNCWDEAYGDKDVVAWMQGQAKLDGPRFEQKR
ncbi:MAG TPA: alpha/beta hydrolase-fold protein [Tepidisphaeraceae bacterium]|jgi:predicted peptidase